MHEKTYEVFWMVKPDSTRRSRFYTKDGPGHARNIILRVVLEEFVSLAASRVSRFRRCFSRGIAINRLKALLHIRLQDSEDTRNWKRVWMGLHEWRVVRFRLCAAPPHWATGGRTSKKEEEEEEEEEEHLSKCNGVRSNEHQ